jgi:hypothetical protein
VRGFQFESPPLHKVVRASWRDFLVGKIARHFRPSPRPIGGAIKARKFEYLRLALDERIVANGLMRRLATELYGLAGSNSI